MPDNSAKKEYKYNILTGKINLILTRDTLKLKAGDTVYCKGLGKYLSGNYYINDVTRTINSSGFNMTATLIRMNFGETLKSGGSTSDSHSNQNQNSVKNETDKKANSNLTQVVERFHTVLKGETLWSIAVKFYNDGNLFTKIAKANNIPIITKNGKQYCEIKINQKLRIP